MLKTDYLFRGKIIYEFETDRESEMPKIFIPKGLPITLGQFTINVSPNQKAYLDNVYDGVTERVIDSDYPLSLLCVDVKVQVGENQSALSKADEAMRNLEAMLRLYQSGGIYVRRHFQTWKVVDGSPHKVIFIDFGTKPEPDVYSLGSYVLDDEFLIKFSDFFSRFWEIIENKHQPIYNSLLRFSSSFEKFTLPDRLIDLMIALEALFNEASDSIAYKVSLRCSSLIGLSDTEKRWYFKELKNIYKDRNAIVHGDKRDIKRIKEKTDFLEDTARKAIIKFLSLDTSGFPIGKLDALDGFLFFGGKSNNSKS